MNANKLLEHFEELDDFDLTETGAPRHPHTNPKKLPNRDALFVGKQDDSRSTLKMTYKAARFEQGWLQNSLGSFYEHQWITDVLRKVKGGKEASVYLCRSGAEVDRPLVAAKVYRPRSLRNLKNDSLYREGRSDLDSQGRQIVNDGDLHAMAKRTGYGEELRHQSWISYEFTTLQALFAAGADVPRPYEMANNAILMEYIGDMATPAPALSEISLTRAEARDLFERVVHNLDLLLAHQRIHGDLSAYNILYWEGAITLIDFPQVVPPESNRNAYRIFERDVTRVCDYFTRMGVSIQPRPLAANLWTKHGYRLVQDIHPKLLDADDSRDRKLWNQARR
jgi:RIO kinase 1